MKPCTFDLVAIGRCGRVVGVGGFIVCCVAARCPASAESERCWNTVTWTNKTAIVLRSYLFRDEQRAGDRVGLGVQPVLGKPSDVGNE
jgi:hypothetical protein